MKLRHEFEIEIPIDRVWTTFTDLPAIASCMPGAEIESRDGDKYGGSIRVRLGPISAVYRGIAQFESLDETAHDAVLLAEGADTRGQGKASARITASFQETDRGTSVAINTDLAITGKAAQFGRGVMADVSDKLLGEFVDRVRLMLIADSGSPTPLAQDRAALDALSFLGVPAVRRRLVALATAVLLLTILWHRRASRSDA